MRKRNGKATFRSKPAENVYRHCCALLDISVFPIQGIYAWLNSLLMFFFFKPSPGTIILMQNSLIAFSLILSQGCIVFVPVWFAHFFTYMSPLARGYPEALLFLNLLLLHSSIPRCVDVLSLLNPFNVRIFLLMPFLFFQCLLFWINKVSGSRSESMWEFNFKFVKLVCPKQHYHKSKYEMIALF